MVRKTLLVACAAMALMTAACSSTSTPTAATPTPVPVSTSVAVVTSVVVQTVRETQPASAAPVSVAPSSMGSSPATSQESPTTAGSAADEKELTTARGIEFVKDLMSKNAEGVCREADTEVSQNLGCPTPNFSQMGVAADGSHTTELLSVCANLGNGPYSKSYFYKVTVGILPMPTDGVSPQAITVSYEPAGVDGDAKPGQTGLVLDQFGFDDPKAQC